MSHFTVLVIGNDPEKQLAPYQENNMGDCPEDFLEFHDKEESHRKQYENDTVDKVIMPDGRLLDKWDNEFRVKGTIGIGGDTHKVPSNLEIRKVPFTELYATFEEFMSDYCGYKERDEKIGKYGYWENPNCKWDWYQLGGRWCGFFKLKSPNMEKKVGEPGVFDNEPKYDSDQAYKRQIDIEGMMEAAGNEAADRYDRFEDYQLSREEFIQRARNNAFTTFAVVKDGKWYERGSMGWWGCVSNEKDEGEWCNQIATIIQELPDDTLLSVYDCHI